MLFLLTITFSRAQGIDKRTETGCNGKSLSVQSILDSKKVLFVVATTANCTNCGDFTDNLASFANFNSGKVSVWAAMNKLSGTPNCKEIEAFKTRYSWNDNIFCFIDTGDHWTIANKFTFYTVMDPNNGNIVYQGSNYREAITKALSLTAAINDKLSIPAVEPKIGSLFPNPVKEDFKLSINVPDTIKFKVKITDLLGEQIANLSRTASPDESEYEFDIKDYKLERGIYFVRVEVDHTIRTFRFVKN